MSHSVCVLLEWDDCVVAAKEITLPFVPSEGMWIHEKDLDDSTIFDEYRVARAPGYVVPTDSFQVYVVMRTPSKLTYNEWVRTLVDEHGWNVEDCEGLKDEPWADIPMGELDDEEDGLIEHEDGSFDA